MATGKHFKQSASDAAPDGGTGATPAPAESRPAGTRFASSSQQPGAQQPAGTSSFDAAGFGTIQMDDHANGYRRVRKKRRRRRRWPRVLAAVLAILVVAVLAAGGLFARSAWGVYGDAKEVLAEMDVLVDALIDGDSEAVAASIATIEEKADGMAEEVEGPLWSVAVRLPVVGTDIGNARSLALVLEDLASGVLSPLAEQADSLSLDAIFSDSTVDVELVGALCDLVIDVTPVVSEAADAVAALEEGRIDQINAYVEQVGDLLATVSTVCDGLSELAPYLEDILGANGSRTYLILAHNPSELKSSGGYIGAVGTLTITDGVIELGEFQSFNDADVGGKNDLENRIGTTEEEDDFFSWSWGMHAGASGVNPDFSREGEMAALFWETEWGGQIDGAIGLDTTVLAYFLGLVGGVTTTDGTVVDEENCVEVLGYEMYWEYFTTSSGYTSSEANDIVDAFFGEVAALAFESIMDNLGSLSMTELFEVLQTSVEEDRLMFWLDDEDEELALDNLGLACTINTDETIPELGIFIDSRTGSKLGWWTILDTSYELVSVNEDGSKTYDVTVVVRNTITEEEVEQGLEYLVGNNEGSISYMFYLYAPAGGTIENVVTTADRPAYYFTLNGQNVARIQFTTAPESTNTLTFTVTTSASAVGDLQIRQTHTAQEGTTSSE